MKFTRVNPHELTFWFRSVMWLSFAEKQETWMTTAQWNRHPVSATWRRRLKIYLLTNLEQGFFCSTFQWYQWSDWSPMLSLCASCWRRKTGDFRVTERWLLFPFRIWLSFWVDSTTGRWFWPTRWQKLIVRSGHTYSKLQHCQVHWWLFLWPFTNTWRSFYPSSPTIYAQQAKHWGLSSHLWCSQFCTTLFILRAPILSTTNSAWE